MKIYADIHRREGKTYLEDKYTQYEMGGLTIDEIRNFPDTVYTCSNTFLDRIGWLIDKGIDQESGLDRKNIEVIWVNDDGEEQVSTFDEEGYLSENWEIGHMTYWI